MANFHETYMGRAFYEGDVKDIRKNLESIAQSLVEANELKAKELQLKEKELRLIEEQLHIQRNQP